MPTAADFPDLLRRVRAGDPEAARHLVAEYEPAVRRVVRFRMTDPRLRAAFDSMDICQSVLGSFFVRAAHGEYDLADPAQLTGLLVGMARNKLATHVRREAAGKRDYRRATGAPDQAALAAASPSPSRCAEGKELLAAVWAALTPDERGLAELRQLGHDWDEIAGRVGGTAVALRKRLSRAMDRVTRDLGLDEAGG